MFHWSTNWSIDLLYKHELLVVMIGSETLLIMMDDCWLCDVTVGFPIYWQARMLQNNTDMY